MKRLKNIPDNANGLVLKPWELVVTAAVVLVLTLGALPYCWRAFGRVELPQKFRLAEELRSRFPESAALPPGEAERRMLADGAITEAGLVELYSRAFQVPVPEEDEIVLPEMREDFSPAFFNAHDCIVLEYDENIITLLVAAPYQLGELAFQVRHAWDCTFSLFLSN